MKDPGHAWNCYDETDGLCIIIVLCINNVAVQFYLRFSFNFLLFWGMVNV